MIDNRRGADGLTLADRFRQEAETADPEFASDLRKAAKDIEDDKILRSPQDEQGRAMVKRIICICQDCYDLKGEMCHEPSCIFIRRTMTEVAEMMDALLIRPVVDGERLKL